MSDSNPTVHIDVARVCELAHFDMAPDEMAEFQGQLEKILGYVEKIGELDLGGIERLAMILFGIDDIRRLYENDARYLAQF